MSIYLNDFIGIELTDREKDFVDSLHSQLEKYGRMTDKQAEHLYILRERKGIIEAKKAQYRDADKETKIWIKALLDAGLISGLRDVTFNTHLTGQ